MVRLPACGSMLRATGVTLVGSQSSPSLQGMQNCLPLSMYLRACSARSLSCSVVCSIGL